MNPKQYREVEEATAIPLNGRERFREAEEEQAAVGPRETSLWRR
jgi:hypothetical protein